jgi:tRNA uridine 5-carboxymethylaminomethyl modification enzyme
MAYIGVLTDDLTTKGTDEPYRMMTSRAEHRLYLRQDNADLRLSAVGRRVGLVSEERYRAVMDKYEAVEREKKRLEKTFLSPSDELNGLLTGLGTAPVSSGTSLAALIRRPKVTYEALSPFDPGRPVLDRMVRQAVEIDLKYAGYIDRQMKDIAEFRRLEEKRIPEDIDYSALTGLRLEAREKLERIRPENLGQASRISGVSPADTAALMIYLSRTK